VPKTTNPRAASRGMIGTTRPKPNGGGSVGIFFPIVGLPHEFARSCCAESAAQCDDHDDRRPRVTEESEGQTREKEHCLTGRVSTVARHRITSFSRHLGFRRHPLSPTLLTGAGPFGVTFFLGGTTAAYGNPSGVTRAAGESLTHLRRGEDVNRFSNERKELLPSESPHP